MKRRLIVGLLFVVFALSLALAACANNDTPPIVTEWQSDANGHRPKGTDVSETVAHVWDVGAVTTPATTTVEGVMKYTCTVCGFKRAESIPKLDSHVHTYCCWQHNETEHWRESTCEHKGLEIDRAKHVWNEGIVESPTVASEGKKLLVCTVCGFTQFENIPKLASIEIAVVTDIGKLNDGGFNQGTWDGAKAYAEANKKTVQYYQPKGGGNATDADRIQAMNDAIKDGAKVIVTPGFLQEAAIREVAGKNADVKFVFIDGYPVTKEVKGKEVLKNVAGISFKEQESGYFAGYAAVKEGFTKLGGTFGGGGTIPACNRYANGYILGATAAAEELNRSVDMKISFKYGEAFSASSELQSQMDGWYKDGMQVVFSCGGSMFNSVLAAAKAQNGKVIGVDVDQSEATGTVITSAVKGLRESVMLILEQYYNGEWDAKLGGKASSLGAKENCVGLPTNSWKLTRFTKDDYQVIYNKLKNGAITIDLSNYDILCDWIETLSKTGVINVTLEK